MSYILQSIIRFCNEESGTTAVEYAVMIALILVFAIVAILNTGDVQKALWENTATKIESVGP